MYTTESELLESYNDMLNECCPEWATPSKDAATNMEEQDNIMYNCGFNDYIDSLAQDNQIDDELMEELGL